MGSRDVDIVTLMAGVGLAGVSAIALLSQDGDLARPLEVAPPAHPDGRGRPGRQPARHQTVGGTDNLGLVAGTRSPRRWTLALWGVCLLAAIAGQPGGQPSFASGSHAPAAVGVLSAPADDAVLPGRVSDEVRAAVHSAPLRTLALAAVLAPLLGIPALLRRRASAVCCAHQPLRTRRHAIALRAPPVQFA